MDIRVSLCLNVVPVVVASAVRGICTLCLFLFIGLTSRFWLIRLRGVFCFGGYVWRIGFDALGVSWYDLMCFVTWSARWLVFSAMYFVLAVMCG